MIKLFNEDCLKILKQDIDDESVDLIVTDPPYGVGFKNDFYDDNLDTVLRLMPLWYKEWYRILKNNSFLFLFVGVKTIHYWINEGIKSGFTYKNIVATRSFNNGVLRAKSNFSFHFQPVLVFSKGNGKTFNTVDFIPTSESWLKDKRNPNPKPYTYDYPNWIKTEWAFATAKRNNKKYHPNEKNIQLLKFFIELTTNKNDLVLDPFMGCGSTGMSCIDTDRNFIGIELDKKYFDVAKERIENV